MWAALAVTALFLWLALRGVPFATFAKVIASADWWWLLGPSIPAYILAVYLRALRWRHLTDPIQPISTGPLFRAVSVGFMANNLFPLRIGEVVRCWYLRRETGVNAGAVFGTVILERVLDTLMVIALALGVLMLWGSAADREIARGALLLVPVAVVPTLVLIWLRVAPDQMIAVAERVLRPFPDRIGAFVEKLLRRISEGLGALRGGTHLVWIGIHTLNIWLVASTIPMIAGFLAVGVQFGSVVETVTAAWFMLAAIGVAVAVPSAPGFFGTYHYACKVALERFGIPAETAVAIGTLVHAVFWLTLTLLGLAVLRMRRTSLGELDQAAAPPAPSSGKAPTPDRR